MQRDSRLSVKSWEDVIKIFLYLSSSPDKIAKADLGILSCLAKKTISSALALPFSGADMTFIFKKSQPDASLNIPITLQNEELGVNLTLMTKPLVLFSKNIYPAIKARKLAITRSINHKAINRINGVKSNPENTVGILDLIFS